jgi:hypothetical protein
MSRLYRQAGSALNPTPLIKKSISTQHETFDKTLLLCARLNPRTSHMLDYLENDAFAEIPAMS